MLSAFNSDTNTNGNYGNFTILDFLKPIAAATTPLNRTTKTSCLLVTGDSSANKAYSSNQYKSDKILEIVELEGSADYLLIFTKRQWIKAENGNGQKLYCAKKNSNLPSKDL